MSTNVGRCPAVSSLNGAQARFDATLEGAAESLGATRWGTFVQVTLPIISPGVMAGAFYAFIVSFGDVPMAQFLVTGMLAVSSLVAVVSLLVIFGVQKLAGFDVISTGQGGKS